MGHEESLRHLLRVAAGLESLVLGEDQILGQVRNAYEDAREAGGIGPLLENGVTKAIRVGERARTETTINEGVVSLASAAVKLAAETRGLENATAAVVGVSEMGTLAAKRLAGRVDELVLVNRTLARAESLATTVSPADARLRTAGLDDLGAIIVGADVVISSTGSSEWLIDRNELAAAGETFLVDIARPRDIPPAADGMDHLAVYDLDSLEAVTEKTRSRREAAAERVEAIVEEEFERLLTQYKRERADEVISAMYEGAERIKAEELEETFATLDLDDQQQATVEAMADSIVSRLLAAPTNSLRDAAEEDDWSTIHTALGLFDPNLESAVPEEVPFDPEMSPEEIPDSVREQMPDAVLEQLEE
jgi:glutamyl-tRNA reductase